MMIDKLSTALLGLCLAATSLLAGAADDDRVVVLTSYPESMSVQYQEAFERAHPGKRLEILWRQSADAWAYLQQQRGEVDVYWTPSPGNFRRLHEQGRFMALDIDHQQLPAVIGRHPISGPGDHYAAFELAGYGISYAPEAVKALGLPAPKDWSDLTDPAYAGQLGLPIPGAMGFAGGLIEALLQLHGWQPGWALLSELAGNAAWHSRHQERDHDRHDARREPAASLSLDFFTASQQADGSTRQFVYPPKTTYNPAQIGILQDAPHPGMARLFVEFALSQAGQELLLHPDITRLPVRLSLYQQARQLPAQPFAEGNQGYDDRLGRERQGLVAALFKVGLVERHETLAGLWQAVHRAEAAGQATQVQEARHLLSTPLLSEQEQATQQRYFAAWPEQATVERDQLLERWRAARDQRLARVGRLLADWQE